MILLLFSIGLLGAWETKVFLTTAHTQGQRKKGRGAEQMCTGVNCIVFLDEGQIGLDIVDGTFFFCLRVCGCWFVLVNGDTIAVL